MLIMGFLVQTSPNQGEIMEPYVLKIWPCNYSKDYINEILSRGVRPLNMRPSMLCIVSLLFMFLCYVMLWLCVCVRNSGFSITQSLHIRENCNLFLVRATVKNLVLTLAMDLCPILAAGIHTCVYKRTWVANDMNLGLCVPKILLKGILMNCD